MIEAMLRCAGYRTGRYMSPHLSRYNERVAIGGVPVDDATLVEAFHASRMRESPADPPTPLTYFEFGTSRRSRSSRERSPMRSCSRWGSVAARRGERHRPARRGADVRGPRPPGLSRPTREHIGREKAYVFRAGRAAGVRRSRPAGVGGRARARDRCAPLSHRHRLRRGGRGHAMALLRPRGPRYGLPMPARAATTNSARGDAIAALAFLRDVSGAAGPSATGWLRSNC